MPIRLLPVMKLFAGVSAPLLAALLGASVSHAQFLINELSFGIGNR